MNGNLTTKVIHVRQVFCFFTQLDTHNSLNRDTYKVEEISPQNLSTTPENVTNEMENSSIGASHVPTELCCFHPQEKIVDDWFVFCHMAT